MCIARPLLLASVAIVAGCSHVNVPLNDSHALLENRVRNNTRSAVFADIATPEDHDAQSTLQMENTVRVPAIPRYAGVSDADGYFVGLALSGGGSRSANFAAAAMFQLERVKLLQHVDYISSVSGGSVTAAYYCAAGEDWNPAAAQKKLTQPFASELIFRTFLPWNLAAFTFTDWDRSDELAGVFTRRLFNRDGRPLTFADLRPDRPRLLINSTDMQSGRRFIFCNETFDDLNADLSRYPLAHAVTASAAVPVVLHPVTLRDYSTTFPQYRHLVDGGVADNLGEQTLVETYSAQIEAARRAGRPDPYPHGAVFVVINAQTRFNARLASLSDIGLLMSLKTSAGLTSGSLLGRASSATLAETIVNNAPDEEKAKDLRAQIRQLDKEGFLELKDRGGHTVRVIYIALSQLEGLPNLPFDSFTQDVNSIETYFNISPTEAFSLYQAADLLMKDKLESNIRAIVSEIEAGGQIATRPSTHSAIHPE